MSFKDILGQDKVINRLKKSIKHDCVSHAYIFEGLEGIGKKMTSFNLAKAIFCKEGMEDSCDVCSSCRKMEHGNYPDYHLISPGDKSILDSQIEELQRIISKKSSEGRGNVILIDKAESMTIRAQNRLLKTMEEPIGDTILILVTSNASGLLDTILSRCVVMKFKSIDRDVIKTFLINKYDLDEKRAAVLAAFSLGSIGKSEKLYNSEEFIASREESIKVAKKIGSLKEIDFYDVVKNFESKKDSFIEFSDMIEYWYRDIIIAKLKGNKEIITNIDYINDIINEANKIELKRCTKIIESMEQAKRDYNMNINYNLLIKNMVLKM